MTELTEVEREPVDPAAFAAIVNTALGRIPNSDSEKRADFLRELHRLVGYCWDCGWKKPTNGYCCCRRDD